MLGSLVIVTNDHKLGGLEQEKAFVSQSEGQKSEVKIYAGLVLLQALSWGSVCVSPSFQLAAGNPRRPWLGVQNHSGLCLRVHIISPWVSPPALVFYKDTCHWIQGPP